MFLWRGTFPNQTVRISYTRQPTFPSTSPKPEEKSKVPRLSLFFITFVHAHPSARRRKSFATSPSKSRIYNIYIYKKSPGKVRMKLEKFAPLPAHTSGQSKPFTSSSSARQRSSKFTKVPASVFSFSLYAPRGYIRAGIRGRGRRTGGDRVQLPGLAARHCTEKPRRTVDRWLLCLLRRLLRSVYMYMYIVTAAGKSRAAHAAVTWTELRLLQSR